MATTATTANSLTVFFAWQSDTPTKIGKNFIRKALDNAAGRLNDDARLGVKVIIDSDTQGLVGTPPITASILEKILKADVFAADLTFVAETEGGKLIPNPNVMIEYGYALNALGFEAMMPTMNTHYGAPSNLPFDIGHLRHPVQYNISPTIADGERRTVRQTLTDQFEAILRAVASHKAKSAREREPFVPRTPVRPPAFFFNASDLIANFGGPGEQELRFKRSRAVFIRLYPSYADRKPPRLADLDDLVAKVKPMANEINPLHTYNEFGATVLVPHGTGITSFVQAFESGELWGISERPFRSGTPAFVIAIAAEQAYTIALDNFIRVYERDFKFRPPFALELGAVGLRDLRLIVPSHEYPSGELVGPFRAASISRSYVLESTDRSEWSQRLREFLDDFYDLALKRRSEVLTDQIVEANNLVPR
ncbi:hypothetical protein [Methyloceanibacter sp. wino2]|uniref:hypothetical protein n=1 Tax=Methyloceanibacter sp. wino2 TaxID=2170729 RepID=UPI000D3E630E|nr:hypothetical protein [Methyloceanibacter sp. wino2]